MRTALLVSGLLVPGISPGQGKDPEPVVTLEVAGPAGLRTAFLATNVGNLLGSDESKAIWSQWFQQLAGVWYPDPDGGGRKDFEELRQHLRGYGGTMRVRWFAEGALIELLPDGTTDLESLGNRLRRLLPGGTQPARGSVRCSEPVVSRERIAILLGDPTAGARLLSTAAPAPPERRATAPIRLRIDLARALELLPRGIPGRFGETLFGLRDLSHLELALRPDGPHVGLELELVKRKSGDLPGILGALVPRGAPAPDLRGLPPLHRFSTLPLSYDRLWDVITSVEEARGIDTFFGFSLKTDLFDNLRPGFTLLGQGGASCCLVLPVKDGETVRTCLCTLLELGQGEASQHGAIEIRTYPTRFDHACHAAVHRGRLLVAFGEAGRKLLEATLDAPDRPGARPQALLRTDRSRPPACSAAGVLDAKDLHDALAPFLLDELLGTVTRALPAGVDAGPLRRHLRGLAPLFARHGLDQTVWYAGQDDHRLYVRFLW